MEELLTKIAELLDMSAEGVLESYPILREQFMRINPLVNIMYFLQSLMGFGVVLLFILGTVAIFKKIGWEDISEFHIKSMIITAIMILIVLALFLIVNYLMVRVAPDLMFLEGLL